MYSLQHPRQSNPHAASVGETVEIENGSGLVYLRVTATEPRGSFDAERMVMHDFKKIVGLARAIAVPTRLYLLQVLGESGVSLTTAAATVGIAASTAHRHLAQLVRAGLVTKAVKGRKAIYRWSRSRWQFVRCNSPAPTMPSATMEGE